MKHDGRFALDRLCRLAALVCLAGLGLTTQARAAEVIGALTPYMLEGTQRSGGGWKIQPGSTWAKPGVRSYTSSLAGGAFKMSAGETLSIIGRAGALPVAAAVSVDLAGAARAVAGCLVGIGPAACGVVGVAVGAFGVYRMFVPEEVPGSVVGPGAMDYDPGVAPVAGEAVPRYCAESSFCAASKQEACTARAVWQFPGGSGVVTGSSSDFCTMYRANGTYGNAVGIYQSGTIPGDESCPASIDALNPAYSVPAGSPIGLDGKCPTARYNHVPYSVDEAVARVVANPPGAAQLPAWDAAVKGVVETGKKSMPATIGVSGPASQVGEAVTTTTTTSAGTETMTKTPTYTYNYEGDEITYNTSNTTVTNNVDGSTTTTVEGQAEPKPQDPEDPCTASPSRVGCLELGSAPDDQVPTAAPSISFSPDVVSLPEGCPAPTVVAGKTIEYTAICDAATNARPWVVISAVFSSLMLVLAAVRQL